MKTDGNSNYYIERKDRYWRQFGRFLRSSNRVIPRYLDTSSTGNMIEEIKANFERFLGELPFVGGKGNILTSNLVSGAVALAYIRALEKRGLTADTIGEVINEIYADVLSSLPWFVKWFFRWYLFSRSRLKKFKAFAVESQLRRYPGNWVMEYVEGDGIDFDFGCDFTQCAIQMFFQKMGAEKYMPYLCATDYTASRVFRSGLQRTMTLALGGKCCDFRYKKNHPALPGLPLEGLPEYRNRRASMDPR